MLQIKYALGRLLSHTSSFQNYLILQASDPYTAVVTVTSALWPWEPYCRKLIFGESEDLGLAQEETLRKWEFIYSFNKYLLST